MRVGFTGWLSSVKSPVLVVSGSEEPGYGTGKQKARRARAGRTLRRDRRHEAFPQCRGAGRLQPHHAGLARTAQTRELTAIGSSPAQRGRGTMRSIVEGACLRVGRAAADPSGVHRSPPPPHSGGGTRRLSLIPLRGEAEAQCLQPDKALSVALVVNLVFLEGDVREAV